MPKRRVSINDKIAHLKAIYYQVKYDLHVNIQSEDDLQAACIAWCRLHHNPHVRNAFSIMNERSGTAGYREIQRLKGLTNGVADMVIPIPSGCYSHLYVELKWKKGKMTAHQQHFKINMIQSGSACCTVRSLEAFKTLLETYLNLQDDACLGELESMR